MFILSKLWGSLHSLILSDEEYLVVTRKISLRYITLKSILCHDKSERKAAWASAM